MLRLPDLRRVLDSPLADALAWPHGVDRYLELVDPRWSRREVRGEVVAVRHQTAGTATLTVEPNGAWLGHRAGQHVQVGVRIDGAIHTRCYSVASSAHPAGADRARPTIELTVKAQPGGLVSSHLVEHAAPGLVLHLSQAEGSFVLPTPRPARTLLISGGSGITPVLSMLRTLCHEGHGRPVTFTHYSFGPDDALYGDEVAALATAHPNVRVVRAYTEAGAGADLHGLFGPSHLDAMDPGWAEADVFVCGPAGLMDAVGAALRSAGRAAHHHEERFVAPAPARRRSAGRTVTGTVTFSASGVAVANDGTTLLEQAEAAGLAPRTGCRRGICHTCTRPKASGTVRNVLTGVASDSGPGDIQICTSEPVGDVVVDL